MMRKQEQKTVSVQVAGAYPQQTAINHADRKAWWCVWRGSYNKDLVDRIIEIKRNKT
jgi:hypothetical protein